jgi:hypothetical protein
MFLISLIRQTTSYLIFYPSLWMFFMMAGSVQQADEPFNLAQGQTPL